MCRLTKPLVLLIAVQAVCLGIGFWFQYQLVISTTERESTESVWAELTARSESTIEAVRNLPEGNLDWSAFTKAVPRVSLDDDPLQPAILLTDSQGTILGFSKAASIGNWQIGQQVTWKTDRRTVAADAPRFGRLETGLGQRSAMAFPISNRDRQLIVYVTTPTVPAWKNSLQSSAAISSGLGFFWTFSLTVVTTVLLSSRFEWNASHRKSELDHDALRNAQDLLRTRDAVIFGLAKLAESRDPETGHHLERISLYSTRFATALRRYPKYQRIMTPTFVRLLGISSVLHDIGKVGVEDTVLLKPGRLTDAEHQHMQQHTLVAGDCLSEIEQRLGASNFLQTAREIALHHHERWDGTGYPSRLAGEDIPLAARIVSICDVYDALRSKRVYKDTIPHHECVEEIRHAAGTQFDPELVEVFLVIEAEFEAIARRFSPAEVTPRNASSDARADDRIMSPYDAQLLESVVESPECEFTDSIDSIA